MTALCIILAALSIWDYPSRHLEHVRLRSQFVQATRSGDTAKMQAVCRKGVELLPDDPTWHYNLACALAYAENGHAAAFDELERAIDLGFRNAEAIRKDTDLVRLARHRRSEELLEYAKEMSRRRIMFGPMSAVDATGIFGGSLALGEQNLTWDFGSGCFLSHMKLAVASAGGNTGDLYMNRDAGHAPLNAAAYPGITVLKLDKEGRDRGMDLDFPNLLVPYPLFGNCSRAYTQGPYWRSISRALMTSDSWRLKAMLRKQRRRPGVIRRIEVKHSVRREAVRLHRKAVRLRPCQRLLVAEETERERLHRRLQRARVADRIRGHRTANILFAPVRDRTTNRHCDSGAGGDEQQISVRIRHVPSREYRHVREAACHERRKLRHQRRIRPYRKLRVRPALHQRRQRAGTMRRRTDVEADHLPVLHRTEIPHKNVPIRRGAPLQNLRVRRMRHQRQHNAKCTN